MFRVENQSEVFTPLNKSFVLFMFVLFQTVIFSFRWGWWRNQKRRSRDENKTLTAQTSLQQVRKQ